MIIWLVASSRLLLPALDLYAYGVPFVILGLEVVVSARVDDKRVYIIGHPVDDDDGGVTAAYARS